MKSTIIGYTLSALVAAQSVYGGVARIQLFNQPGCVANSQFVDTTLNGMSPFPCQKATAAVNVPELNATYPFIRLSNDAPAEILLFPDQDSCNKYPLTYDASQEVAFIRAAVAGVCNDCPQCGENVKSIQITTISNTNSVGDSVPKNPANVAKNSAGTFSPSTLTAAVAAGVAAYLMA